MYLFVLSQILNIAGWQLGISTAAIIISFIVAIWKIDRARKRDFKDEINKKADVEHVKSELKNRDEKINTIRIRLEEHEKNNYSQFESIKDNLEEIQTIIENRNNRIDEIYKILIDKK